MPYKFNPFTINLDYVTNAKKPHAETFENGDLDGNNQITITHNHNAKYFGAFTVFDSNDVPVTGVTLTPIDADSATLDMTGFAPISGEWAIVVVPGRVGFLKTSDVTFGGDSVTFGGDTVIW